MIIKWVKRIMDEAFELGRIAGRAEARTEALRSKMPDAGVVESTLSQAPKQLAKGNQHAHD